MNSAAEILVIILSVFLAIFLLLGIILLIYLIRLSAEIKRITESARRAVDTIESTVVGVGRLTSPVFVAELIGKYIKKAFNTRSKKGAK
jgi:uncharacterized protein YoxC